MGHQRLGAIAKSKKWDAVVGLLADGSGTASEDVRDIAALTLDAAAPAIEKAVSDVGLQHAFYLLTQIVLAARNDDWLERLDCNGIHLDTKSSIFDLTSQLQIAIDDHVAINGYPSDISEMAQQAAGDALTSLAVDNSVTLFGSGGDELRAAIRDLSTSRGFARLGQRFFGRFTSRFLNFYLSRITASAVGNSAVRDVTEVSHFNDALRTHCEQSAFIARDFCGQWYSKTTYLEGINEQNTSKFMAVALKKLRRELSKQRADL